VLPPPSKEFSSPAERLAALLRSELGRLAGDSRRLRLFFEFWLWGMRNRGVRARIRAQLDRYREAFIPLAGEVIANAPERFKTVRASGLAHACAGFVKAAAVQSVVDPRSFRLDEYVTASAGLMAGLAKGSGSRRGSPA
jgi:hypothetical protein